MIQKRRRRNTTRLFNDLVVAVLVVQLDNGVILHANDRVFRDLNKSHDMLIGMQYRQVFMPEFLPVSSYS